MYCTRKITEQIHWIGGSDRRLSLFENLFPLPNGVSYNSYLIADEKTAILDTVDSSVSRQFLENICHLLQDKAPDYLIINHMEPDHCAGIEELLLRYPSMTLVGNAKTISMLHQFFEMKQEPQTLIVKEGDTLSLGKHSLSFYMAPMVHWPEVMMTYEETEKILFSADAFGTFGALNGNIFNDEITFDRVWLDEARRYYSNIVGKYGPQVQAAFKKLSALDIQAICPLHGPIWRTDLEYILDKYQHWSQYQPEEKAVAIFYGSMYGDTENAANILAAKLADQGMKNIAVYDVSNTHVSTMISEVFRCSHLVLAAPTYNNGVYPAMAELLHDMKALNVQNRTVAFIENGTWAPASKKLMTAMVEELKNMEILEASVTIKSALHEENEAQLEQLAQAIVSSLGEK